LRIAEDQIDAYFSDDSNIGVLTGEASGNFADVDLDCAEAVAAAPFFLPPTGMVWGHEGKPRSHYGYRTTPLPNSAQFKDIGGAMLLEMRAGGGGHQTVVPPGVHEDDGEAIVYYEDGEPIQVNGDELMKLTRWIAGAALLAQHWPEKGSRHDASLALASVLLRLGMAEEEAERFILAAATAADDEEANERVNAVHTTAEKLANHENVTGVPRLGELVGQDVVTRLLKFIDPLDTLADRADKADGPSGKSRTAFSVLVELADAAELFHGTDGKRFASVPIDDHEETWPLRSEGFEGWLRREYYRGPGGAPPREAMSEALDFLDTKARIDGLQHPVFTRVGQLGASIYVDLGNEKWEVVEIGHDGWRVLPRSPVKFRRSRGTLPLPKPLPGGNIESLRNYLNLPDRNAWMLFVTWLVAAYRADGPYPILVIDGEQGSAKSTLSRIAKRLTDPSAAPLRALPSSVQDLAITAQNSRVLVFDNLSTIPTAMSDALCRLATGGGFATRALYSNDDEAIFDATRPIILNGIEAVSSRPDLLDRAVSLNLEAIPPEQRKDEEKLWERFDAQAPAILGSIFDGVSYALEHVGEVTFETLPRMTGFARWGGAVAPYLGWTQQDFLSAYDASQVAAAGSTVEDSSVVTVLWTLLEKWMGEWAGSATELLAELNHIANDGDGINRQAKDWPDSPTKLGGQLKRLAPDLRRTGIDIQWVREGKESRRIIKLKQTKLHTKAA